METATNTSALSSQEKLDQNIKDTTQGPLTVSESILQEVLNSVTHQGSTTETTQVEESKETFTQQQDSSMMTEEEKEAQREKKKYDGWVPPEKRRPLDEFFDLKTLQTDCKRIEVIARDSNVSKVTYEQVFDGTTVEKDAIVKFVLVEGKGTKVQNTDDVYYRHETRHDNG